MIFKLSDIQADNLKEAAGVYVFYFKPEIAIYDLYESDDLSGSEELIKHIDHKFIGALNSKSFNNKVDVGYETNLEGELTFKTKSVRDRNFANLVTDERFRVDQLFENYQMRLAFKNVMNDMGHLFSSPIYVGVSHNVSERVFEHIDAFYEASGLINKSAQVSDDDFGARVAKFANDEEIYVTAHYFDDENYALNKKQAYELAIVTEWVLQQQYKPLLGKK